MTGPRFIRQNGLIYLIKNDETIQRSKYVRGQEVLISTGMTIEEQIDIMGWISKNGSTNKWKWEETED